MAEVVKFHKKEKMFFKVEVDDEVLSFPIGSSMPVGLYDRLASITKLSKVIKGDGDNEEKLEANTKIFNELIGIYKTVLPGETFSKLGLSEWSVDDLVALFNMWQTAALKVQGITLGESQASASS